MSTSARCGTGGSSRISIVAADLGPQLCGVAANARAIGLDEGIDLRLGDRARLASDLGLLEGRQRHAAPRRLGLEQSLRDQAVYLPLAQLVELLFEAGDLEARSRADVGFGDRRAVDRGEDRRRPSLRVAPRGGLRLGHGRGRTPGHQHHRHQHGTETHARILLAGAARAARG
jgi:hypothetical protein